MKKILIIGVAVILAIIAAVFYLRESESSFFKETSLYTAVPVSVPVFIELNSLKSIPLDNPLLAKWIDVKKINEFSRWINNLDSIIKENSEIQNGLRSDRFILALGLMGDKNLTPLFIQKAESTGRKTSIDNLVRVLYSTSGFNYDEIDYAGYKIISATAANNKKSMHYCFASGLLIASPNLVLVQQALLQLMEPGITAHSSFSKLTKIFRAEPDLAFFVNQQLFPDFLTEFVNSKSIIEKNEFDQEQRKNHYRNILEFKKYAAWSELEVELNENDVFFKGVTIANDSLNHYLSVFNGQSPQRSNAGEILPGNTSYYTSFSFSDKSKFFEKLENYFTHAGAFYKREDLIRKMESNLRVGFKNTFQTMVKSEMIVAITDIPTETEQKTTYFIFDVNGKSKTENLLDSMMTNFAKRENKQLIDFKSEFSVNDKKNFTIVEFPFPSFPGIWLGKPFYSVQAKYAVFYKDFLVFCNTAVGLQNYLTNMETEEILIANYRFKRIRNNSENKSNISSYFNTKHGLNLTNELLSAELVNSLKKNKDILQRVHAINWQVSGGDEVYANELSLIFDDGKSEGEGNPGIESASGMTKEFGGTKLAWQCKIEKPLITKPFITLNQNDKTESDVMVQDDSNNLYQVGSDGKIRWKIDVDDPILSEIYQIDYLANGELVYVFSTKSKLFLVDNDGAYIKGFPVKFPVEATAGLSVFDYDNNRKYRFFVPCDDRQIYVYNSEGEIISGWLFEGTKSEVTNPIQHFRIRGKDYIVFKDEDKVYIQNRRGETIAKTATEVENSGNPIYLLTSDKPRMVTTDTKGTVYSIDFDGSFTENNVGKFDDDHFFVADDLNGDNKPEYIFVNGKELTITNEAGAILFTQKFANKIQQKPNIYSFGPKLKKVGIVDSKANRIYLLDITGQQHPGFPLQGASEFSIGKIKQSSKNLNLIVGSKGGSLYNYLLD